jgi:hypothetical protein
MRQRIAEFLDIFMGFRKVIVWFTLLVIGVIFRYKSFVDGEQFVELMKTVTISFFAGNSVEHFTTMVKTNLEAKMQAMRPPESK